MGRITSNNPTVTNAGGVIDINTLTRQPPQQTAPKSSSEVIIGTIERVLNMPNMQPVIQQGARLISAYADKMILENNEKMKKQTSNNHTQAEHKPVFGVGAEQP